VGSGLTIVSLRTRTPVLNEKMGKVHGVVKHVKSRVGVTNTRLLENVKIAAYLTLEPIDF
jgi:hypothetical protein